MDLDKSCRNWSSCILSGNKHRHRNLKVDKFYLKIRITTFNEAIKKKRVKMITDQQTVEQTD